MTVLIDSYPTTNYNTGLGIKDEHPSDEANNSAVGQVLTVGDMNYVLDYIQFYLWNINAPTSDLIVKVYATTGTVGTTAKPTGSALAESLIINAADTDNNSPSTLDTFKFLGHNKIILSKNTAYAFVVEANTANVDSSNYVNVAVDSTSPTHSGNTCMFVNGSWTPVSYDAIFYLYGWKTYPKLFNNVLKGFKQQYDMSADVTLQSLALGSQNGTTGWHALDYTGTSTIEMPIFPKSEAFSVHSIGAYARYEYIGFTLSTPKLYDKTVNAADQTFRVLSVTDYWVGDKFAYNVVGLEKLTEYD